MVSGRKRAAKARSRNGSSGTTRRRTRSEARSSGMVSHKLRIGIVCYSHFGGSGVVATELGMALARRGCEVHFIAR